MGWFKEGIKLKSYVYARYIYTFQPFVVKVGLYMLLGTETVSAKENVTKTLGKRLKIKIGLALS